MSIDWEKLQGYSKLLAEVNLQPVQGTRFQPTGFPDLGAAHYEMPSSNGSNTRMVLVESAQSMANRLESASWNEASNDLETPLKGMPYVRVKLWDSGQTTNSILEAHRLNSYYIMSDDAFKEELRKMAKVPARGRVNRSGDGSEEDSGGTGILDRRELAKATFHYDPCTVLHGVFLEKVDGRARLQRCISAFIEAKNVEVVASGGVKNDRVAPAPSGLAALGLNVSAREGVGNVPFHRTEFVAKSITAYFNIDLAQIRAYGLSEGAEQFLVTLALWKIRRFLDTGLRLRTACDLAMVDDLKKAKHPNEFTVPSTAELAEALPGLIQQCASAGLFASPAITELTFQRK